MPGMRRVFHGIVWLPGRNGSRFQLKGSRVWMPVLFVMLRGEHSTFNWSRASEQVPRLESSLEFRGGGGTVCEGTVPKWATPQVPCAKQPWLVS
jgi:hypothetical protein